MALGGVKSLKCSKCFASLNPTKANRNSGHPHWQNCNDWGVFPHPFQPQPRTLITTYQHCYYGLWIWFIWMLKLILFCFRPDQKAFHSLLEWKKLFVSKNAFFVFGLQHCSQCCSAICAKPCHTWSVHEIIAGHRSLSGTISCVTDRICFLPRACIFLYWTKFSYGHFLKI